MITVLCCGEPMFTFHDEARCKTGFLCSCGINITLRDERLARIAEPLAAYGITQLTSVGLQLAIQATNQTTKEIA